MLDNQKTPSKSGKHPARRGLFMFFVIVAVAVVAGGTYWQYRHAEEIPASTSAEDSLVVKNREVGEAFLAKTAKEPGVKALGGGLLYKVLKSGSGSSPTASSTVVVDYEGRLIDGTVFDSSYKRGETTSFPLNQVIKGWQEGLKHMPVGSEYELVIPYTLAYGEAGTRGIPPFATLIFKVELKSIKK